MSDLPPKPDQENKPTWSGGDDSSAPSDPATSAPKTKLERSLETVHNPLQGGASVLALRDIRQCVQKSIAARGGQGPWEEELLALDPLTVLRCLRVAHAPIYGTQDEVMTIPELRRALGRAMVRRALNTPPIESAGTGPLRQLWLHAIATAHAARMLAEMSGEFDPDQAYVLGLLHDLPLWFHFLQRANDDQGEHASPVGAATWLRQWNLPSTLCEVVEDAALGETQPNPSTSRPTSLIAAAELLAELADFWHPDDGNPLARNLLLSVATKEDLVAAHKLRQDVSDALATVGVQPNAQEPKDSERSPESLQLFRIRSHGNIAELVLSLMSCNDSNDYRGLITATTASCLRYLGFERAYYVQWNRDAAKCFVRAKSDLSPRALSPTAVRPSPHEIDAIEEALETGNATRCLVDHEAEGLLNTLSADEVLIAPINRGFAVPTVLVMDRTLSGTPIQMDEDSVGAAALAGTASLLTENLVLKRGRERAEKYSLTDPLTRLFNRNVGITALGHEIIRAKRSGAPLTALMLDMDDFKALNDSRGHLAGDHALRTTADVLRKTLRRTDVVCRYGGEEFLVVLPETSLEEASVSATRIFTAVQEAGTEIGLPLTISVGLATVHPDEDDVESVLVRADRALYASKSRGRNRFSVDEE